VSGIFARVVNIHGRQRGASIDEWKVIAVVEVTVTVRQKYVADQMPLGTSGSFARRYWNYRLPEIKSESSSRRVSSDKATQLLRFGLHGKLKLLEATDFVNQQHSRRCVREHIDRGAF
jgi:hypothetical protein